MHFADFHPIAHCLGFDPSETSCMFPCALSLDVNDARGLLAPVARVIGTWIDYIPSEWSTTAVLIRFRYM